MCRMDLSKIAYKNVQIINTSRDISYINRIYNNIASCGWI